MARETFSSRLAGKSKILGRLKDAIAYMEEKERAAREEPEKKSEPRMRSFVIPIISLLLFCFFHLFIHPEGHWDLVGPRVLDRARERGGEPKTVV